MAYRNFCKYTTEISVRHTTEISVKLTSKTDDSSFWLGAQSSCGAPTQGRYGSTELGYLDALQFCVSSDSLKLGALLLCNALSPEV